MNTKKFVFLDIENTLIEEFESPTFITTKEKVSSFVEGAEIICCFSWAINNVEDLHKRYPIVKSIQDFYNFTFWNFIFRDELFLTFKNVFGAGLDFNEFEDLCRSLGKEYVFQLFIRKLFANPLNLDSESMLCCLYDDTVDCMECYLYDDTVENTTLITHINGIQITIKTVKV